MPDEIKYLRASAINSYIECGSKYFFQYVEKIQTFNKLPLAFGTSVHRTLQENFLQKIGSREDLPVEAVKDIFSTVIDEEFSSVDPADFKTEDKGEVKDSGIELVEKYHREVSYRIFPVAVEQKIQVKLRGYDYGLQGTIDLRDEDGVLIDHKTTGKDFKTLPESYKLQVGGSYPLLIKALSMQDPAVQPVNSARIDYLIRRTSKSSGTQIRHIPVPIDQDYFLNVFSQVSKGISTGIYLPNRSHLFCSRKWCKFADICEKKFKGKVKD